MIVTANNSTSAVENIRTVIQTGPALRLGPGPARIAIPASPAPPLGEPPAGAAFAD